jgi:hypothetical protein
MYNILFEKITKDSFFPKGTGILSEDYLQMLKEMATTIDFLAIN